MESNSEKIGAESVSDVKNIVNRSAQVRRAKQTIKNRSKSLKRR